MDTHAFKGSEPLVSYRSVCPFEFLVVSTQNCWLVGENGWGATSIYGPAGRTSGQLIGCCQQGLSHCRKWAILMPDG